MTGYLRSIRMLRMRHEALPRVQGPIVSQLPLAQLYILNCTIVQKLCDFLLGWFFKLWSQWLIDSLHKVEGT